MGRDAQKSADHQKHSQSRPHGWEPTRGIDVAHTPKPATLAAYQTLRATKIVDTDATWGAQIGVNLLLPNGKVAQLSDFGSSPSNQGSGLGTTDELAEGQFNLYFTNLRAQDAVGGILTDTTTIDFTYNSTTHSITADLKDLADSGAGNLVGITRDSKGRVSGTRGVIAGDGVSIVDNGTAIAISIVGLPIYIVSQAGDQITDQSGAFSIVSTQTTGLPVDWTDITSKPTTLVGYGITDAQKLGDPVYFPPYTIASVLAGTPPASGNQYKAIYVTGMTGGDEPCVSDGTNWRRFSDRSVAN